MILFASPSDILLLCGNLEPILMILGIRNVWLMGIALFVILVLCIGLQMIKCRIF